MEKLSFRPSLKFDLFCPCHSGKLTGEKDDLNNSFILAHLFRFHGTPIGYQLANKHLNFQNGHAYMLRDMQIDSNR